MKFGGIIIVGTKPKIVLIALVGCFWRHGWRHFHRNWHRCLVQMLMQMYLLHHKIQRVLEVQDNHEGIDYYPPYHVWPSSTTALLDKPSRTALLVMYLPTQGLTWKYDVTIFASSAAYGTCLSFSPIGSGLQAMKAAGILWGSWLSAWDCCIVISNCFWRYKQMIQTTNSQLKGLQPEIQLFCHHAKQQNTHDQVQKQMCHNPPNLVQWIALGVSGVCSGLSF